MCFRNLSGRPPGGIQHGADRGTAVTGRGGGLLAVFLAGVPLEALAAGGQVAAGGMSAGRAQARWRQVPAVLLQDAPQPAQARSQASLELLVRARWTAPGGAPREGEVYAPGDARSGATVLVWADGPGRLELAPVQRADVTVLEAFAALAAALLAAAVVVATGFPARRGLDRRRLAAWDADWSRAGPRWTGRLCGLGAFGAVALADHGPALLADQTGPAGWVAAVPGLPGSGRGLCPGWGPQGISGGFFSPRQRLITGHRIHLQ